MSDDAMSDDAVRDDATVPMRCAACGRFRAYAPDDRFCLLCGHDALETACACGRAFNYALVETGASLHCPRCGRAWRGRASEFDP
jgi:predicted RNA-binding Zn-ribbon protein involved in translation (DUF1610 family)